MSDNAVRYVLGIDQGGTKTNAIVADEDGNILGFSSCEGSYYLYSGMDNAMQCIKKAADTALANAGIKLSQISAVAGGLTGADWAFEYDMLTNALKETFNTQNVTVVNDCIIGMRAATHNRYGGVIALGTGVNVAAISPSQECYIFGFYIDHNRFGGGGHIGRRAVEAMLDSACGIGDDTMLTQMVLDHFRYDTVEKFLIDQSSNKVDFEYKHLCPSVFKASKLGDTVATDILKDQGKNLARFPIAGFKKFNMKDNLSYDLVLTGSVFKSTDSALYHSFCEEIKRYSNTINIVSSVVEPIVGAAVIGIEKLDSSGKGISLDRYKRLVSTALSFNLGREDK